MEGKILRVRLFIWKFAQHRIRTSALRGSKHNKRNIMHKIDDSEDKFVRFDRKFVGFPNFRKQV